MKKKSTFNHFTFLCDLTQLTLQKKKNNPEHWSSGVKTNAFEHVVGIMSYLRIIIKLQIRDEPSGLSLVNIVNYL